MLLVSMRWLENNHIFTPGTLCCFQLKSEDGQLIEKKRKKRAKKQELMMEEDDSEEDCAAMKCLKPTGEQPFTDQWNFP